MEQKIIRTHDGMNYSNLGTINSYLEQGWRVVHISNIGTSLEYVIEKVIDKENIPK